ncbi:DUF2304 domain-containing protein [Oerskovia enterophila]|uniref:DUF2304 domain-containing protein n=1 Tax=Oerskovia enterophila TaxID=43678 RepID=UPI0037F95C2D
MLIQIILIAAIVVVSVMLTRSTANARHQAIRRLLLATFVVAAVLAIIFPDALSFVANAVGVGRGTDLLLYALVIAFVSYIATSNRRLNELGRKITLLTRELSLAEAELASVDSRVESASVEPGSTSDDTTP